MTNSKIDIAALFDLESNVEQLTALEPEFLEECILLRLPSETVNPFIAQLTEYAAVPEDTIENDLEVLRYFSRYMLVFTSGNNIEHYPLLFTTCRSHNHKNFAADLERKNVLRNIETSYAKALLDFDESWLVDSDGIGKRWSLQLSEWRSKSNLSPSVNEIAEEISNYFYDYIGFNNIAVPESTTKLLNAFKTKTPPLLEIPKTYPLTRAAFGVEFSKIHKAYVDLKRYQGTLKALFQRLSFSELVDINPNTFGYKLALAEGNSVKSLLDEQEEYMEKIIADSDDDAFYRTYGHRPNLPLAKVVGNVLLKNKMRFATIDELKRRARTNILNTGGDEESGDIYKEIPHEGYRFKVTAKQRIAGKPVGALQIEGASALPVILNNTHVGFGDLMTGVVTVDQIFSSAEILFEPDFDKVILALHYPLQDSNYRADNFKVAVMGLLRQFNVDTGMDFDTALRIVRDAEKEETCDAMLVEGEVEALSLFIDLDQIKRPGSGVQFDTETHHYTISS